MKASSRIWVGEGYNCLVEEESPVDNFWYLDGELGLWDMDVFCSLAMDLGNSEGNFCIVELGLDKQEGCLIARLHIRTVGSNTLVGRRNLVGWRMIWVNGRWILVIRGVNFGIGELGRLDKWMHHSDKLEDYWDD